MEFSGITRHIYACPETFAPEYLSFTCGGSGAEKLPRVSGGGKIQPPGSEWRRSKFGGAVLLRAGATECDESKCSSRLLQPCRMVDSSSSPSSSPSSSSATVQQRCFRGEQKYRLLFFLLPSDFFHSLRHFVLSLSAPLPLAGCRVSLCSCHTGPPTLTHGGREKLNAYFVPKIVYVYGRLPFPGKAARWDEAKKSLPARGVSIVFLFKCGGTNWITLLNVPYSN